MFDKMLENVTKLQLAFFGVILGVCLIFSASLISNNFSKDEITVTGTAAEIVTSDSAKWSISFKTEASTRLDAYNKMPKSLEVVKKFLVSNGLTDENVELGALESYPKYKINPINGNTTQEINGWVYTQYLEVDTKDVELVKKLENQIQGLVSEGVDISNSNVQYYYSELPKKKAELLSAATLDAKNRAAGMLKATHNRVGKMRSVKMGVFQITTPESNDVSDWGVNDTSTIEKKITAVANVVFSIR